MVPRVERISAITFQVTNMQVSVQLYRDVLGIELIYGGEESYFSSLRAKDAGSAILNLEKGNPGKQGGRLILYVTDVDAFWTHLKERGFDPPRPQDGAWGERYFHMPDPDSSKQIAHFLSCSTIFRFSSFRISAGDRSSRYPRG
jgi:catechol 2,3-dioxygenase-like lactoylglutathione lyase family enzyme